jgi:hypothetical protein
MRHRPTAEPAFFMITQKQLGGVRRSQSGPGQTKR